MDICLGHFGIPRTITLTDFWLFLQGDFPASKMINSIPGIDPARREKLMKVLDINPSWRMHQVSDGQRRRVQICLGLLKPYKVQPTLRHKPLGL